MKMVRKFKFRVKSFFKNFNSIKKEIRYTLYGLFICCFLVGAGLHFIPHLLAFRGHEKTAGKITEHIIKKAVSVTGVEIGDLKKTFTIFSSLKGKHEVQLYTDSKVSIRKVLVAPGSFVKKGQELVEFESSVLKIRKRLSDIDFQLKEAEYQITKNLADKEFVSKNEMNQKSLEFEAEKLRQELARSESTNFIIAPIAGLVTEVKFNDGDYIDDASKYYVKIVDQTSYRIEANLPYEVAKKLNIGGNVEIYSIENTNPEELKIRVPASGNDYFGKITHISPGLDQSTGTVSVDVEANLPMDNFQIGSFVESKFILNEVKNTVIVKNESILYDNDRPYVFKLVSLANNENNPFVQMTYVTLGANEGSRTAVLNGLNGTDLIVHEGQNNLKDKDIVEVFGQ